MKRYVCCVLCGLLSMMVAGKARADWRAWTLTATKRVLCDDPAGTGTSVKLEATRNKWESFQILLRSEEAVKAVNLEAEVEKVVLPLASSWFQWETNPIAYQKARARLAEMIVAAKKSPKMPYLHHFR